MQSLLTIQHYIAFFLSVLVAKSDIRLTKQHNLNLTRYVVIVMFVTAYRKNKCYFAKTKQIKLHSLHALIDIKNSGNWLNGLAVKIRAFSFISFDLN